MDSQRAVKLLDEIFNQEFDIDRFAIFIKEFFNHFKFKKDFKNKPVPLSKEYQEYIEKLYSLGIYHYPNREMIEVFAVKLKRDSSVERARTMQRNAIATYLKKYSRNAALVAFYGDNHDDWRFSFVKVDYELFKDEKGDLKFDEKLTPAKRYSFLVGQNEPNHTCKSQFLPLIKKESEDPTIEEIEKAFSVEKVTKEFFDKYKDLYLDLKESLDKLVRKDPIIKAEFEEKNIITADFAKKLMGQIVFIYFLQKKGWLGVKMDQEWGTGPRNFLRTLYDNKNYDNFFNDVLEHLFYDALATDRYDDYYEKFECRIPFLNGGLFEPINLYNWRKTDIKIDNKIFGDILDTFDLFNFTIKEDEPLERIVAVDPEMLGKVFENLLEVEDRKSKGAFYTPREIVHHMCQQSLINYLNIHLDVPKEDLENFIQLGDFALDSIIRAKELGQSSKMYALPESIITEKDTIDKLINDVKIVDPAVGSGAFLVGMMNEILKVKSILSLLKNESTINYDIKRQIIENALYGVDIDSSAVDVTKLRFWLSLIVDEEDIADIKPLPNLDHKIMCGNSLLEEYNGIKLFDENILLKKSSKKKETEQLTLYDERLHESRKKLKRLKKLYKLYFNEQNKRQKSQYREEIEKIEWEFIEETLKEEDNEESIKKLEQYKKSNSKPFFLWKLYFAEVFERENPGFDIVIANPPYLILKEENTEKIALAYISSKYESAEFKINTYSLFIERGLELLRDEGNLSYIIPDTILTYNAFKGIRKLILKRSKLIEIDYFINRVFEGAEVGRNIIIYLNKIHEKGENRTKVKIIKNPNDLEKYADREITQNLFMNSVDNKFNILLSDFDRSLLKKIEKNTLHFEDICTVCDGINPGSKDIRNNILIMEKINDKCQKIIDGRDFSQYSPIFWRNLYVRYDKDFVESLREKIKQNGKSFTARVIKKNHFFDKPKIVTRQTADKIIGTIDLEGYYTKNSVHSSYINENQKDKFNLKYLLSILNSNLITYYYRKNTQEVGRVYSQVKISTLEQLPIRNIPLNEQNAFIEIVDKLFELSKQEDNDKFGKYIKKLNSMVYNLYELTPDEILAIEKNIT